jgi:hypothetical protein
MQKALFLVDSLDAQVGGSPEDVIKQMNTMKNKYLMFKDRKIAWTFDENNKKMLDGSIFLANGAMTAVFSLKLIKNETTFKVDDKTQYILRVENNTPNGGVASLTDAEMNQFITQWKMDKRKYPKNIIDIFYYGALIQNGVAIGKYTLTRRYNDESKFETLNLFQKQQFMCNMLRFLAKMKEDDIFYRDFKWWNIGFDDDINFIVLDYDFKTLLRKNHPEFIMCVNEAKKSPQTSKDINQYNHTMNYCNGTFLPYHMMNNVFDKTNPNFDKAYCVSLAMILIALFYSPTDDTKQLLTFISQHGTTIDSMVKEGQQLQQIATYIKADVNAILSNATPSFTKQECEIANMYYKTNTYEEFLAFLRVTIENLISLEYKDIMYPNRILNLFVKVMESGMPPYITQTDVENAYCTK